jgi:hypothetical protein
MESEGGPLVGPVKGYASQQQLDGQHFTGRAAALHRF